jgi:PAS domain S-box-containing protein
MRPKSKAELTAEIKTLQTRIHNLEAGVAPQRDTTAAPYLHEQEFRALVEHCPDVIARFDSALRHTYVSPAVQVVTGLPPQAFIGKTNRELGMPPALAERWEAALRQVFKTGQEVCIEFVYASPDGPRHYESRLFADRARDGVIAAVCSIARDVTDRKRVEEALRESVARFRSLWEYSMDGILLTVPDGRILMASPAACRILGRSEEEICRIGRAGVVDQTDPQLPVLLEERARTGECKGELRFIRPDGTARPCEITSAVFTGRDGLPWTSMCIHDISERKQAEEALRSSEENFRRSLDDSPLGVRIVTTEGETVYANRAVLEIYGYDSIEELRTTPVTKRYTPESYAGFQIRKRKRQRGENVPSEYEISIARRNGEVRHLQVFRKEVLWDGERQFQTIYQDITERKRVEATLRESENCFRELFNNMSSGVAVYEAMRDGQDFVFRDFNRAAERIDSTQREAVLGRSVAEVFPGVKEFGLFDVFQRVWRTGQPAHHPVRVYDDSRIAGWRENYLYKLPSGEIVAVYDDITERKVAEEALATRTLQLEAVRAVAREIARELNLPTLLQLVTQRAGELLGGVSGSCFLWDESGQCLTPIAWSGEFHPEVQRNIQLGEGLVGAVAARREGLYVNDYRTSRFAIPAILAHSDITAVMAVPLLYRERLLGVLALSDRGAPRRFSAQDQDLLTLFADHAAIAIENARLYDAAQREITGRKQAEAEQKRLLAELEAKNRELEAFVYTVSHGLKAPLVSLDGFSSVLQKQCYNQLGEKGKHYLERIQANVIRMDALIRNLLELSRIGLVVGQIEEVDVTVLLREVQDELAIRLKEATAEVVVQEPLPALRADRGRIHQVFTNLLDNAVKFRSAERALRIEVGCRQEGDVYRFHVADNGLDIAPQYHEEIFAPFRKLHPEIEGVGMGLTLVKKIVEHHGGRIWVESEAGKGSTFYFTIPRG